MAERIVSPGVFTREVDRTQLAEGVANIGGAIVGPFQKGPTLKPILIQDRADLEVYFGRATGDYYTSYTAEEYIKEQGTVTIVRIGGLGGYKQNNPVVLYAQQESQSLSVTTSSYEAKNVAIVATTSSLTDVYTDAGTVSPLTSSVSFSLTGTVVSSSVAIPDGSVLWSSGSNPTDLTTSTVKIVKYSSLDSISGSVSFTGSNGLLENFDFDNSTFTSQNIGSVSSVTTNTYVVTSSASELAASRQIVGVLGNTNLVPTNLGFKPEGKTDTRIVEKTREDGQRYFELYLVTEVAETTISFSGSFTTTSSYNIIVPNGDTYTANAPFTASQWSINDPATAGFIGAQDNWVDIKLVSGDPVGPDKRDITVTAEVHQQVNFNLIPGDGGNLLNAFGRSAQNDKRLAYLYSYFKDTVNTLNDGGINSTGSFWSVNVDVDNSDGAMDFTDGQPGGLSEFDASPAMTPWIVSQNIEGERYNLFRFITFNEDESANTEVKVTVENVRSPSSIPGTEYGSFTITVREYSDTDKNPNVLEQYNNVNLDPLSPNYIARVIGDRDYYINENGKIVEFGDYANISKYVRVEVESSYPEQAIPYGFKTYLNPIADGDGDYSSMIRAPKYSMASTYSTTDRYYSGTIFNDNTPDGILTYPQTADNTKEFFSPIPFGAEAPSGSVTFAMDDTDWDINSSENIIAVNGSENEYTYSIPATYEPLQEQERINRRKFIVGFQGGFAGHAPNTPINIGEDITATNQQGLDCSTNFSSGSVAYNRAIAALGNADEWDINLLVTPGIIYSLHRSVATRAISMCEDRGDCFYIMDIDQVKSPGSPGINSATTEANTIDSNYVGTYYPWVKIIDPITNKLKIVPPSVVMPAVYAQNDKVAAEWFAPAGLNRGGITSAIRVVDRLTHRERDTLYENNVNPITTFPGQGIVAFGQKTLQRNASALDRINVRRLLINLKKFISSSSRYLLFEQNTTQTRNRFLSIVNPYLESVQQRQGLYAYRVIMDETNNTPDLIDRNILYGQIQIQPARAVEFIILDFELFPTGASFNT